MALCTGFQAVNLEQKRTGKMVETIIDEAIPADRRRSESALDNP